MPENDGYQLPEEERTDEYSEHAYSNTTENIKSILMNRRVQLMLGGIVGLTVLMYVISPSKPEEKPKDPEVKIVKTEEKKEAPTAPKEILVDNSGDIKDLKSDLEKKIDSTDQQLRAVLNQLDSIVQSREVLQKNTTERFNEINTKLAALMTQLAHKDEPEPTVIEEPVVEAPKPKHQYRLRAMIDNRAWLGMENNSSITVTVGDSLGDDYYGTVTGIYPDRGLVTTSSGHNIYFNENAN